jgi:putative membrane protein
MNVRSFRIARIGLLLVAVVASFLAPAAAWAQERSYEWGWGMHPMGWMWGVWGIGMMLMMLLFGGLVITGIGLGIRWLVKQGSEPRSDSALEILRQRYARGEINGEEFEARKRDLS